MLTVTTEKPSFVWKSNVLNREIQVSLALLHTGDLICDTHKKTTHTHTARYSTHLSKIISYGRDRFLLPSHTESETAFLNEEKKKNQFRSVYNERSKENHSEMVK